MTNAANTAALTPLAQAYKQAKPAIVKRVKQLAQETYSEEGKFTITLLGIKFNVEWDAFNKLIWVYRGKSEGAIIRY